MPFDGRNPHSVVVMDNCSSRPEEVVTSIQDVGALHRSLFGPLFTGLQPYRGVVCKGEGRLSSSQATESDAAHN